MGLWSSSEYDAFGARRNPLWGKPPPASFSSLTTMGFTGHESDDELGLINMKGRMYDPKVGRFLTTDPMVSDPYSGQDWNPYSYVANNPLTYVDPSGFSAVPVEASSPPPDCTDQGRLCGSSGKGIRPVEVTVHRPKSMQGPREEATQHGAAATPTDVGTVGTAVGVAPTPDPTATSSVWRNIGSFALGLGKAYAHQVLDYTRSTTLNVLTLGGYGFFKFWWHIGEKAGEAIVESQRLGEHGFDVALSGLSGGLSAVSPLHQVAASITNIKTAAKEGDYERLGEAAEPVLSAIVVTVVTGKLAGLEAGAEAVAEGGPRAYFGRFRNDHPEGRCRSTTGALRCGELGTACRDGSQPRTRRSYGRAWDRGADNRLRCREGRVTFWLDLAPRPRDAWIDATRSSRPAHAVEWLLRTHAPDGAGRFLHLGKGLLTMTTLLELLGKVDELDAEDVIFAKPEWRPDTDAKVFRLTDDNRLPGEAKAEGYNYFLEVDIVKQVLEEFRGRPGATLEEKCNRVIHYAIYDA